jgi:hypothetical protein
LKNPKTTIVQLQALEFLMKYHVLKKSDLIEISLNVELDQKASA